MATAVDPDQRARLERLRQRERAGTGRRQHPARNARLAALVASGAATVALGGYLALADDSQPASAQGVSPVPTRTTPGPGPSSAPGASSVPVPSSVPVGAAPRTPAAPPTAGTTPPTTRAGTTGGATAGALHDGNFTGAMASTRWGPVQVVATVSGGRLTSVDVPVFPDDRGRSVAINQRAVPILEQEALASQGARIDNVSGATYTTTGFRSSLQGALTAAQRGG